MSINIIGINTLHCQEKRDHQVKYKKSTVKLSASQDMEKKLKLKLSSTGIVIDIEFLQNQTDSRGKVKFIAVISFDVNIHHADTQTKSLVFWVKDEIGALARALEEFTVSNYMLMLLQLFNPIY